MSGNYQNYYSHSNIHLFKTLATICLQQQNGI